MALFELAVPNIYRLKIPFGGVWTGVFLVTGPEHYLIDSGGNDQGVAEMILPGLKELGYTVDDIAFLLCTHTHGDHVGGHHALIEAGLNRIACFEGSVDIIRDPLKYNIAIRQVFPGYSAPPAKGLKGCEPNRLLKDGEVLGGYLRIVHTPGHDADACCILDERTGTLITGDSLQWNGTDSQGIALVLDLPAYLESLDRLEALAPQHILAGHPYEPDVCQVDGEAACRESLRLCRTYMDRYSAFIKARCEAGERDPAALAEALIREMNVTRPGFLFLPMFTVTQHMKALGY